MQKKKSDLLIESSANKVFGRRSFLFAAGLGAAGVGLLQSSCSKGSDSTSKGTAETIQGFEQGAEEKSTRIWQPVSDRKVKVGIVGYGYCKFGASFGFQNHPNVEVVAVSDLIPERCAELAKACNCKKTYASLEELVKDPAIEAVFVATDAPSHARHAITVLKHGKHVASAVPAFYGSLEDAYALLDAVKSSGKKYMMFETSYFHEELYEMRELYKAGFLGEIMYSEGEYYHFDCEKLPSYKDWRICMPPQWYPTHNNAYHIGVTGGSFTEVSCHGIPSIVENLKSKNNQYKNPFGTEIAFYRTSEGGTSRQAVSWDTPGDHGERGRIRGQKGSYYGKYEGLKTELPNLERPPLPPRSFFRRTWRLSRAADG